MNNHQFHFIAATTTVRTFILAAAALVAACGGPADRKMITTGTQQQYRDSIDAIDTELSPHERAAFNWAVAGMNLEELSNAYPNASVRQVVRGQVRQVKAANPKEIAVLREKADAQLPTLAELQKVGAVEADFRMEDSFFGPKPIITARITNSSTLPLSEVSWDAALYINGDKQPVARSRVRSDFRSIKGLRPDHQVAARFTVGFVKGDQTWTTLAIRQAATTRVELEVVPDTALDYSDKTYVTASYQRRIEVLQGQLKEADKFADI